MTNPPPRSAVTVGAPCAVCGTPVAPDSQFCLACGAPVSTRSRAAALGAPSASTDAASVAGMSAPGTMPAGGSSVGHPVHPLPPTAAATLVPSNYGWRVLAFVIDFVISGIVGLIVLIIVALAGGFTSSRPGSIALSGVPFLIVTLGYLVYPLVMLLMQAFLGFTIGKLIMGLRVVRSDTFALPGLGRMIVRDLVVAAASLVFGIGQLVIYLSPLWDARRLGLGWHDKAAHTWVIDVRRGPNPLERQAVAVTPNIAPNPFAPPPAPPVPPATIDAPPPAGDADTDTAAADDDDIDSTRLSAPRSQAPLVTPVATGTGQGSTPPRPPTLVLRFDTGETIAIARDGLLGRDPAVASKLADALTAAGPTSGGISDLGRAADPLLIRVPGDASSVSKTHLEFGIRTDQRPNLAPPAAPRLWITDRTSTNGTVLRVAHTGAATRLEPGVPHSVSPGDTVTVGTRSFTVEEAR